MPSDRLDGPVLVRGSGLPASGRTTHAREVERRLVAIRLRADDWREELVLGLWDEDARDRIEQRHRHRHRPARAPVAARPRDRGNARISSSVEDERQVGLHVCLTFCDTFDR